MNTKPNNKLSKDTDAGQLRQAVVVPSAPLRIRCKVCGWISTGRVPRGGDGSFRYPRLHRVDGQVCGGMVFEGEWL